MALTRPKIAQIYTNVTALNDAITVLNAGASQANVDVGLLINRAHGLLPNAAFYYSETLDTFVTAFTNNSGGTDTNVVVSSYADITSGNVYTTGLYWTGNGQPITLSGGGSPAAGSIGQIQYNDSGTLGAASLIYYSGNSAIVANAGIASTSATTGSFQVIGGAGITGNLNVGGNVVGGGVRTTTSATPPSNPVAGDIWYNTTRDTILRYTDDGVSKIWIDINGPTLIAADVGYGNVNVSAYLSGNITTGNVSATGYYFANGTPFTSSNYGSTEATGNVTMVTNYRYICDTTTTSITLTLPASAVIGDEVGVLDGTGNCNVHNITVARNGHKIQGLAEDLTVSTSRAAFTLVYYNVNQGWLLTQV